MKPLSSNNKYCVSRWTVYIYILQKWYTDLPTSTLQKFLFENRPIIAKRVECPVFYFLPPAMVSVLKECKSEYSSFKNVDRMNLVHSLHIIFQLSHTGASCKPWFIEEKQNFSYFIFIQQGTSQSKFFHYSVYSCMWQCWHNKYF